MAYEYSDLISEVDSWAKQSEKQGWIDHSFVSSLLEQDQQSAEALFSNTQDRPLVVAFMGGTGVGKSSLLNKLAGQSIARTGVERPTSREVTLYHHQSVALYQLQDLFSLQQIQVSQHSEAENEKVIWIDMPDFDSTEENNKNIVMQWLPYIDLLVYVVSPERYRDNKAWQLLLSESASHAWVFVMNQWDRGDSVQYDDFEQQLAKAGFDNPLIYKTSCVDNFDQSEEGLTQLQKTIESLATEKTVKELELRGEKQRNNNLKQKLQQGLQKLGNEQVFEELSTFQDSSWLKLKEVLKQGLEWPIKQASVAYSKTEVLEKKDVIKLWDDWAQNRFDDYIDELILTADQQGLSSTPLRNELLEIRSKAEKIIHTQTELACRQSLINPGNLIQRVFLKLVRVGEIILPLMAMSLVGFQVFDGYYDSSVTSQAFLGVNFVVHSLLLILISWMFPYFILKKMQPSLAKAALKGLNKGLEAAMTTIEIDTTQAVDQFKSGHQQQKDKLTKLITNCEQISQPGNMNLDNENLVRMLVSD